MPTFGYTTPETGLEVGPTTPQGSKFTVAEGGTVTELHVYVVTVFDTDDLRVAIYNDDAGSPATKRVEGGPFTIAQFSGGGWRTVSIANHVFTAGTYWLLIWSGIGGFSVGYKTPGDVTNQSAYQATGVTYPTWPDPLAEDAFLDRTYCVYATYTGTGDLAVVLTEPVLGGSVF